MKDFFILTFNPETIDVEQLYHLSCQIQNFLEPTQKLICIPDSVNLIKYSKEELKIFLKQYKTIVERFINE